MHLLSLLSPSKSKLIIVMLSFLIALFTIIPVLKSGISGTFYSIDPDAVYTANALLFIKDKQIFYTDHPGTPAIVVSALALSPFRLYAKYISHEPFISWAYENFPVIFLYLRMWQSLMLFISLTIFALSVYSLCKSILPVLTLFLTLLAFVPFYYIGNIISAESFSFLVVSIWLYLLMVFMVNNKKTSVALLSLVGGFSFAVRATNFFLLPASLMTILYVGGKITSKFKLLLKNLLLIFAGFFIGVLPIKNGPVYVINRLYDFAGASGIHGTGNRTLFDLQTYYQSAHSFFDRDREALFVFIFFSVVVALSLFVARGTYKRIAWLALPFIFGAFVFAKYSLAHYQITNYALVAAIGSILFYQAVLKLHFQIHARTLLNLTINASLLLIAVLIFTSFSISQRYQSGILITISKSTLLAKFSDNNHTPQTTVWEWGPSRDFALLWVRDYTGVFDEQIRNTNPGVYELRTNPFNLRVSSNEIKPIDSCWGRMYLQNQTIPIFLKEFPKYGPFVEEISNTDMSVIKGRDCNDN